MLQKDKSVEAKGIGDPESANFPRDAEGRVYHLGLKTGEVANRVLMVGDPERAKLLKGLLDHPRSAFALASNRGFTTFTGTRNGKPISIMSIGMGMPMMDMAVRELRAVTKGPLAIIRLGSCGTLKPEIPLGSILVANHSFGVLTDYDSYPLIDETRKKKSDPHLPFKLTQPLQPNQALHENLVKQLSRTASGTFPVMEGTDATADSFYSSQGRSDPNFGDRNETLIEWILSKNPDTVSLQMETFHLFHLARLNPEIGVAACAFVLAQRKSDQFLSHEEKHKIEQKAGEACLKALEEAVLED